MGLCVLELSLFTIIGGIDIDKTLQTYLIVGTLIIILITAIIITRLSIKDEGDNDDEKKCKWFWKTIIRKRVGVR